MLGKIIKILRNEKNMTQQDLAKLLNVSPSTIGMYEQGRRDPDTHTIKFLADFFGVSTDYLLGKADIPTHYTVEQCHDTDPVPNLGLYLYENIKKNANAFFMDDQIAVEDKEALFKYISELFWESKAKYSARKKSD